MTLDDKLKEIEALRTNAGFSGDREQIRELLRTNFDLITALRRCRERRKQVIMHVTEIDGSQQEGLLADQIYDDELLAILNGEG